MDEEDNAESQGSRNALERMGDAVSAFAENYFPDPFIFTLGLTFLTMALVLTTTPRGPVDMAIAWGVGFWSVMQFSIQAGLILLAGWVLGSAGVIRRGLQRLAVIPKTHMQALIFGVVIGFFFGLIHSIIGLIVNSLLAREIAINLENRDVEVHYPLLVAACLVGVAPSGQGITSVAPLLVASEGHFLESKIGVIPMTETILTLPNLAVIIAIFIASLIIIPSLLPPEGSRVSREEASTGSMLSDGGKDLVDRNKRVAADGGSKSFKDVLFPRAKFGEKRIKTVLLDSPLFGLLVGLAMMTYVYVLFSNVGVEGALEINTIITVLLGVGFILNMRFRAYKNFLKNAWRAAGQWLIQFQFYGGIMGLLIWSGLMERLAAGMTRYTTDTFFYAFVTIISAVINLLIPSAGGQWIVTGEMLTTAAIDVGADINITILAFVFGDQLTNVVHPFILIPVFAIAGVSFKHLGGYLVIAFTVFLVISVSATTLFGVFL